MRIGHFSRFPSPCHAESIDDVVARNVLFHKIIMQGLLTATERVNIRLGSSNEILSADPVVFEPQHEEESRLLVYESDFLTDYLQAFSNLLRAGKPRFVTVTEPGRETSFQYHDNDERSILLTRAHRGVEALA